MSATGALDAWGWDATFEAAFAPHAGHGPVPGRIVVEEAGGWLVRLAAGERLATLAGRYRYAIGDDPLAHPAVGDWVAVEVRDDGATIVDRLARRTVVVRRAPAHRGANAQVVGANVDILFVVMSLNRDFNLRRLERYLSVAWESGAAPVVLLSKSDLTDDVQGRVTAAAAVAPGVPVEPVSAVTGDGLDGVRARLRPGRTAAFVGSSGVGKSTLVNALAGRAVMSTAAIREDDARGRHTTNRRQLVPLGDGLVLDTPGMRELGLADPDGLAAAFADVATLAAECRFRDCRHGAEPGCAVRAAIADGSLSAARLSSFERLEREALAAERRTDAMARITEQRRWKAIAKQVKARERGLERGWR
jgi:ribosome biogenesis GTPase